jgi:hypothetical protein
MYRTGIEPVTPRMPPTVRSARSSRTTPAPRPKKGAFERALDAELAEHDSHARQNSFHLKALAEENVEDFEETHDPDRFNRIRTDALGREHGNRYKSS